jgi:hypothetical protein
MDSTNDSYIERQQQHNREYMEAWENAPEEFRKEAALRGLNPELEDPEALDVKEFNDNYLCTAIIPDMAATLDQYVDCVIEKHGIQYAVLIRNVFEDLKIPMNEEITKERANLLGRIAGYLIYMEREKGNMLSRLHALLHAVPRFAQEAGFSSMRASAKACSVSPEWLRRKRDEWCAVLGVDPPSDGVKSDEAKQKYKKNATDNHWRKQKYSVKRKTK